MIVIKNKSKRDKLILILLIIGIGILIFMAIKNTFNKAENEETISNLNDSLQTWIDKEGRSNAKISLLESNNITQLIELESKDSTINKLQQIAEEYKDKLDKAGSSVTTVSTETRGETTAVTEVSYDPDIKEYPIYRSSFNMNGWIFGSSIATKDTTTYDIAVRDEFDFIIGYEKQGFLGLGKPKPFAQVRSHNPYSVIQDFRTYRVSERKQPNIIIGPVLGYGLTGLQAGPFIGVGATYPLIRIRL